MKISTAIFLSILLLTQVFSKWLVVLEYNINKEYIASKLCVNKERPKLLCQGKCQLMKKLAAEEDSSNSSSGYQFGKISFSETNFETPDYNLPRLEGKLKSNYSLFIIAKYTSPVLPILHPPALA